MLDTNLYLFHRSLHVHALHTPAQDAAVWWNWLSWSSKTIKDWFASYVLCFEDEKIEVGHLLKLATRHGYLIYSARVLPLYSYLPYQI